MLRARLVGLVCCGVAAALLSSGSGGALAAGGSTPGPVRIAGTDLLALACPAAEECVAVGGDGLEVTFDPRRPRVTRASRIDRFHSVFSVACPARRSCTAGANPGRELTFDPDHAGPWAGAGGNSRLILPGSDASTVACASVRICVAAADTREVTFDPRTRVVSARAKLPTGNVARIACPSPHLCAAVDYNGHELSFDPERPRASKNVIMLDQTGLATIACPSASQCTTVGENDGVELTFDPHSPGSRQVARLRLDDDQDSIACPTTTQCTALGDLLVVTFNPATTGRLG